MLKLLRQKNFFIYWLGEMISVVGDHISVIAFPWLVLSMTGSPAMTGLVLAAQGLPRAILMLYGGTLIDRYSPRMVMIVTDIIRFGLMLGLGFLIASGHATLPIIFITAALFGIADAFFYPATISILPSLVKKDELPAGNAIVQMTNHTAIVLGPIIAGVLIAGKFALPDVEAEPSAVANFAEIQDGLARAFIVDAFTFGVSIFTLLAIKVRSLNEEFNEDANSILGEIKEALAFVWSIPAMRLAFLVIAVLEFFFQAPIFVGLPALAKSRFADGVQVYTLIVAAYGAGALMGAAISGSIKQFVPEVVNKRMFLVFAWSGLCLGLAVIFEPYQVAMFLFFTAGLGDNFMWVQFTTWLQQTTPERLMGRVMSIFMFIAIGLLPVANMIMGFLFELDLEKTLIAASIIMFLVSIGAALHRDCAKVTPELRPKT